ncbi:MAG: transposase [Bacteroidota bacterium]
MLEPRKYYHIYNRANGWEKMFFSEDNYRFFISRYRFYLEPIVDTFAYCLIPNHLHFLIRVKSKEELIIFFGGGESPCQSFRKLAGVESEQTFGKIAGLNENELSLKISRQFSKLFSSYTQSFNKVFKRKGSLFIPNFKRKEINSDDYLKQVVIYIHNNPVKHGIINKIDKWKYSSYNLIISGNSEWIKEKETIGFFNDKENFISVHKSKTDVLNELRMEE